MTVTSLLLAALMQTKTRCAAFAVSSNGVHRVGARGVARVTLSCHCFCVVAA
jgi:hypothetical protein